MQRFIVFAALLAVAALLAPRPSSATDHGQWASVDPAIRHWYETRQLTPAAQQRLGWKSCCAHSDVVKTRFKVSATDRGDDWFWLDGQTWKRIPADIVHRDEHAPGGAATLFVAQGLGVATCFFPPDGGI